MYTKESILKDYTVNDKGIITSPGKFEGCMLYIPYFYDEIMNGASDETIFIDDVPEDIFIITPQDVKMFPELQGIKELHLAMDDNGFVHSFTVK